MAQPETGSSPLFTFSSYPTSVAGLATGAALVLITLVWQADPAALGLPPPKLVLALFVLTFGVLLIALAVAGLFFRVWSIRFYDAQFVVRTRGMRRAFEYREVKDVRVYSVFSGFRNRTLIQIHVLEERPFTISGNPHNQNLGTNLYSFLLAKSGRSAPNAPNPVVQA